MATADQSAEVIIACRGELQENLQRTVSGIIKHAPDAGVCVVFDGDQPFPYDLPRKVRQVRPWTTPRGCGQARHYGIETSDARYIILTDGHCELQADTVAGIVAHIAKPRNAGHVTCHHMQSLAHDWTPIDGQLYRGARLVTYCQEPGNQFWPLAAKWNRDGTPDAGIIGAPMGACYGFRRAWYAKIGKPLGILEAWGQDEELLAICSWLCGGAVYLLPAQIGHMYAAPRVRQNEGNKVERADVWANRYATLHALPMADDERKRMLEFLSRNGIRQDLVADRLALRMPRVEALRDHLAGQRRNWADMLASGLVTPATDTDRFEAQATARARIAADQARIKPVVIATTQTTTRTEKYTPPPAPPADKPQVIIRKIVRCQMCDAVDSFVQVCGVRAHPAFGQAYARCRFCGHKAHIRVMQE